MPRIEVESLQDLKEWIRHDGLDDVFMRTNPKEFVSLGDSVLDKLWSEALLSTRELMTYLRDETRGEPVEVVGFWGGDDSETIMFSDEL